MRTALRRYYRLLTESPGYKGRLLNNGPEGYPLTHELLEHVDVLRADRSLSPQQFDEKTENLQRRFRSNGTSPVEHESPQELESDEEHGFSLQNHTPRGGISMSSFPSTTSQYPQTPPGTMSPTYYGTSPILSELQQMQHPQQPCYEDHLTQNATMPINDPSRPSFYHDVSLPNWQQPPDRTWYFDENSSDPPIFTLY